jgi:PAS domain S-box-containing protein
MMDHTRTGRARISTYALITAVFWSSICAIAAYEELQEKFPGSARIKGHPDSDSVLFALVWLTGLVGIFLLFRKITLLYRQAEEGQRVLTQKQQLLEAINRGQQLFIASSDDTTAFNGLLDDILNLSGSESGFIAEIKTSSEGELYLHTQALSNVAWDEDSAELYHHRAASGFDFHKLHNLFGATINSGVPVIVNDPANDFRSSGVPEGHPPINNFLGIPIFAGDKLVAMTGLANRSGGYDQAVIDFLHPLLSTIAQLVEARRNEINLLQTDAMLGEREDYYRKLIDHSADAIFVHEITDGRIIDCNQQACNSLGYSLYEILKLTVSDIDISFSPERDMAIWTELDSARPFTLQGIHKRKDGSVFPVEVSVTTVELQGKKVIIAAARDTSERMAAEEEKNQLQYQLLHSQKMEAIGRLAGGVAHDYNNKLTVILGYAELLKTTGFEDRQMGQDYLEEIINAARHAQEITRKLLLFSRNQKSTAQKLYLDVMLVEMDKTLRRLIGEHIKLALSLPSKLWPVHINPTQFDQIIVNLTVNACDAMPEGGILNISAQNVTSEKLKELPFPTAPPGDYVLVTVQDNGMGMDEQTKARIFEPFFTTKEVGKGTGLGLPTIYGIVKQHNGFIAVQSRPGEGTRFDILFPKIDDGLVLEILPEESRVQRGSGTILLVEDDEAVRQITRLMLERIGYNVHSVATPELAIAICKDREVSIDCVLTDVIMPVMNGVTLRKRVNDIRPELPFVFMSGYTADIISQQGIDSDIQLVPKPLDFEMLNDLLKKVIRTAP